MDNRQDQAVAGQAAKTAQAIIDLDLDTGLGQHEIDRSSANPIPTIPDSRLSRPAGPPLPLDDILQSDSDAPNQKSSTVLYLAYGSNLTSKTFRGRRGIKPLGKRTVVVPELALSFDLAGLPYVEPCFANVRRRNALPQPPPTHHDLEKSPLLGTQDGKRYHKDRWTKGLVGVVYEVTRSDFAKIIATEGGGNNYQDIIVQCHPLDSDSIPQHPVNVPFGAHTLFGPPATNTAAIRNRLVRPDPSYAQASARYLKLITDGAEEHGLPFEYQQFLQSIRPYSVTTYRQLVGKYLFTTSLFPVVVPLFILQRITSDDKGHSPRWLHHIISSIFSAAWRSYDLVFKHLFGDGERTIGQ